MFISSHYRSAFVATGAPLGTGLRRLARAFERRIQRLDLAGLSEEMKRDLGFADGRVSPPRDPLRD
jgi:hypothetical protein